MTTGSDVVLTPSEGGSGAWAELNPGAYRAQVTAIEDVGVSEVYPADGPRLKFTFTLLDEPDDHGVPIEMFRWCSQKLTTGAKPSNLWKWAEALGCTPRINEPFAISQLIGHECQVVIEMKTPQSGGEARPSIGSILPPTATGRRTPKAQRAVPSTAAPAATESLGPCFICDGPGEKYDGKGRIVCEKHAGVTD